MNYNANIRNARMTTDFLAAMRAKKWQGQKDSNPLKNGHKWLAHWTILIRVAYRVASVDLCQPSAAVLQNIC